VSLFGIPWGSSKNFSSHSPRYFLQDTLPRYIHHDGRNTLAKRLKVGICELCGNKTDDIRMHYVRAPMKLSGKTEAEQLMLHMHRSCARIVTQLHLLKNCDGDCAWSRIRGDV